MTCLSHTDKLVARFELSQIFFYCRFQKRRGIFNEQETFNRKKLDGSNLQDVMNLQQKIISGLHPDEQHFILHRTEADYMKSLNGQSSNMLGVFDGDELIAQTVYGMPHNGEERDMPEFRPDLPNEDLVLYEAILVDPAYRGSSLMKRMLEYIEGHAIDNGRKHAIIQIAVDNPAAG